ncbi:MAG: SUMF1/EgtB/PvdO family nonheme iron enzyme [Bacteroidales bacterium]|nr:SUMF1/EgtB/PvdO family nonheme iron enzyme [Bacteroidales bacterium]
MISKLFLILFLLSASIISVYSQAYPQEIIVEQIELVFVKADAVILLGGKSDNYIKTTDFLKDYYIGKYEITNAQYAVFLNENGSNYVTSNKYHGKMMLKPNRKFGLFLNDNNLWVCKKGKENLPVSGVTWYGANEYCVWLSHKTGKDILLPDKKQWVYAATCGNTNNSTFSGTSRKRYLNDYAWFLNNSFNKPQKVGTKKPNDWGIFDMTGNVREWCFSYVWSETEMVWVDENNDPFNSSTVTGTHQEEQTTIYRSAVLRGGGWADNAKSSSVYLSPSYLMSYMAKDTGFRICLNI